MTLLSKDLEKYSLLFGISYVIVTNKLFLVWSKAQITLRPLLSILKAWFSRGNQYSISRHPITLYLLILSYFFNIFLDIELKMLGRRKRYFFQLTGFTNAKKAELKTVITKLGGNFVENDVGLSLSFCRAPFKLNSLEYGPYCPPPPPPQIRLPKNIYRIRIFRNITILLKLNKRNRIINLVCDCKCDNGDLMGNKKNETPRFW